MDGVTSHHVIRFERPRVRIDVIRVPVDDGRLLASWVAHGSAARRARAARYHFVADAIRCLASEALLRCALRDEHRIDLDAAMVTETHLGKPFLADHLDVHFNLSHSGEWMVCALADRPVGVDVEVVQTMTDWPVAQFMSDVELDRYFALDSHARMHNFYRLWTMKESVLKAVGTGFSVDPCRVTLRVTDSGLLIDGVPGPSDGSCWEVRPLDMPDGVYAAVCAASRYHADGSPAGPLPAARR
jgi:4'-phosphopantetheinyl transferase